MAGAYGPCKVALYVANQRASLAMTDLQAACARIEEYVANWTGQYGLPGVALAVIDREGTVFTGLHGYANLDTREPVDLGHLFQTGSIGKSFTAISLLQLHEEGKLDLHAPVTAYLPWFDSGGDFEPVTIHHLLTHTGGIIGMNDVLTDKLFDIWAVRNASAGWQPGNRYHYSNVGYKTLGLVLERIENSSYGEIIRRRILDPLGMARTDPETTHETRRRLATGYLPFYDDRPWLPHHGLAQAPWSETAFGEGCICSPIDELATYMQALMNRDERLLSTASYDLLTSKHVEVEPDHWYGYGLDRDEVGGHTVISHGGEMPGYKSWMFADLDIGLGFTVMTNTVAPLYYMCVYVHSVLVAAVAGEPLPELPQVDDRTAIEDGGQYAGAYVAIPGGARAFELVARDGRLFQSIAGVVSAVWRAGEGAFIADHPDYCRLPLRFDDESGDGQIARHGDSRYWRVEAGKALPEIGAGPSEALDERGQLTGHYRTFGATFTNFRIVTGWNGCLLFVHPSGEEWRLQRIDQSSWRIEDMPETVCFDTFVDGQALRASFSGCPYYRTFTA